MKKDDIKKYKIRRGTGGRELSKEELNAPIKIYKKRSYGTA